MEVNREEFIRKYWSLSSVETRDRHRFDFKPPPLIHLKCLFYLPYEDRISSVQCYITLLCIIHSRAVNNSHDNNIVILEKLTVAHFVKKFPTYYGTRRFITVFTTARHWSLSWARWIQFILSHPIPLRFILISSCHLGTRVLSGLFLTVFRLKFYMHLSCVPRASPISLFFICLP